MLELGSFPPDLSTANPTSGDPISDGFKHLNLLKNVVANTFPNLNGQITSTPAHLNNPLLRTERPPVPTQLGEKQKQSIPFYDSNSTAGTLPISDYGKLLMNLQDANAFKTLVGGEAFVQKTGDTMTGPLSAPAVTIPGGVTVYVENGVPTIQAGSNKIQIDTAKSSINFVIGGVVMAIIQADGALRVRGDIQAFSDFA